MVEPFSRVGQIEPVIDAAHPSASWFLWIGGSLFLLVYALPLLLVPMRWAKTFQWADADGGPLTVYFGRCLGGAATAIVWACFRAAPEPTSHPFVWEAVIVSSVLMLLVHLWGAIRRTQPWTEDAEVILYACLAGLSIWLYAGF